MIIINAISNRSGICDLFAEQMGIEEYRVEQMIHSATDLHGESDISIVLSRMSLKTISNKRYNCMVNMEKI